MRHVLHEDQEGDVHCKLAQQGCEDVRGEDVGVGALAGKLRKGLGMGDEEEHARCQQALQRGLQQGGSVHSVPAVSS